MKTDEYRAKHRWEGPDPECNCPAAIAAELGLPVKHAQNCVVTAERLARLKIGQGGIPPCDCLV